MLGDPIYIGLSQCTIHRIGCHEAPENVDNDAINLFNKLYACFRVGVEAGILGPKWK